MQATPHQCSNLSLKSQIPHWAFDKTFYVMASLCFKSPAYLSVFAWKVKKNIHSDTLERVIDEAETNVQLGAINRINGSDHFHTEYIDIIG